MTVKAIAAFAAFVALAGATTSAEARRYEGYKSASYEQSTKKRYAKRASSRSYAYAGERRARVARTYSRGSNNGRPRAWCGWWMRQQRGGGPEMNLAWNWSRWGSPASPQVGAVVVWRHHVGEIVGRASNGMWLVRSGNDGGAVRTRARSIAGAVVRI